jgi:hypothetical protein
MEGRADAYSGEWRVESGEDGRKDGREEERKGGGMNLPALAEPHFVLIISLSLFSLALSLSVAKMECFLADSSAQIQRLTCCRMCGDVDGANGPRRRWVR